jgi:hypothetical protein
MSDVIIKNVPTGAEAKVQELAMVAIQRFIKARDVKIEEAVQTKYESDIDTILVANELPAKFAVEIEEVEDEPIKEILLPTK